MALWNTVLKLTRQVIVKNKLGLHARPATKLVELAQKFDAELTIIDGEKTASAASVMGLLVLASAQGNTLTIISEGDDATAALDAVQALIEANFDEE
ncbi:MULTISPECIES: HPr family phosphocarrier protein [unclassified Agarivorans]|uniref:HPr family phosphocarrier protein n=1 Tax=unclassified Agarivorans TaxID=2636026 RepID=UPI001575395A|nr:MULTISPECIES: HPr family phosphocarrier protein [unclassified Agarivorans]MDO6686867.1 HPr family phosphocarrier protein [Agarivorans sp. 3_MG-2023]MDO6716664.1 HPr family phosphocarrier protein [Agarivorans sp. 2_MG-2023]MDO6764597.1 HPr family phosphocarrier protein [Agarivorans sp. 1_MG-2023]